MVGASAAGTNTVLREEDFAWRHLPSIQWTLPQSFDWASCDGKLLQYWSQLGWRDQFGRVYCWKQWHWRRIQASQSGQWWIYSAVKVRFLPYLIFIFYLTSHFFQYELGKLLFNKTFSEVQWTQALDSVSWVFISVVEITREMEPIAWVCCASGNIYTQLRGSNIYMYNTRHTTHVPYTAI